MGIINDAALIKTCIVVFSIVLIGIISSLVRNFSVRSYTIAFGPKTAQFIDSRLTFIGVIHHELSHILLALLTGAMVTNFELFKPNGRTLGEVRIVPRGPIVLRAIQKSLSGMAPILCGTISLYILYVIMNIQTSDGYIGWKLVVYMLLALVINYHMSMSKQDVKISLGGIPLLFIIIYTIFLIFDLGLNMYIGYIKIVFCIQLINLIIPLLFRVLSYAFRK